MLIKRKTNRKENKMINLNIYLANIPRQESVVKMMKENKTDSYVFIAPETIE